MYIFKFFFGKRKENFVVNLKLMKAINILLCDPRHSTVGTHSMFVPINIGYIGSHIINQFKNKQKINLKLSTDPIEIFDEIK